MPAPVTAFAAWTPVSRSGFADVSRQGYMQASCAERVHVAAGEVEIAGPFSERLTQ
jgi:hypothetical protein